MFFALFTCSVLQGCGSSMWEVTVVAVIVHFFKKEIFEHHCLSEYIADAVH